MRRSPQVRGAVCGLAAAASFGLSAPLAKILVAGVAPSALAGLLYLGAAIALSVPVLMRRSASPKEAHLRREDVPFLLGTILAGGIVGPVLMLIGLARVSAVSGSLLLNLEAPFTMILAVVLFGEHLGRRGATAAGLIVLGAAALAVTPGPLSGEALGALAIGAACLSWALDNNLTQRLSSRDPVIVVWLKATGAAIGNIAIALILGDALPALIAVWAALALGALSYGLSIVLDTYALRLVGAAREAAYFATAPFFGALVAWLVLNAALGLLELCAAALMLIGVALLVRERHSHVHRHEPLVHDHMHVHDEHHDHRHEADGGSEPHSHVHQHEPIRHAHPHDSDAHHRHRH